MSSPSQIENESNLKNGVAIVEAMRQHLDDDQVTLFDTYQQGLEGDVATPLGAAFVESFRGAGAALIGQERWLQAVAPFVWEEAKRLLSPGYPSSLTRAFRDVFLDFVTNSRSVKSRNMTFGAFSADGGNAGDGTVYRLTVDDRNVTIEGGTAEIKTFRCVQDQTTGARKHGEVFDVYGKQASKDTLDWANHGSGASAQVVSHHAGEGDGAGGSMLRNGSFSEYDSTGDEDTKFPGWVIGTAANVTQITATYFRGHPGSAENTPGSSIVDACLEFTADTTLTQRFANLRPFDAGRPYFYAVRWMRKSSATGTLRIRLGAHTTTVDISTGTNDVWNTLYLPLTTSCWPLTFSEQNGDVTIEVTSLATGTLYVDDCCLAPFDLFDGEYFFVLGGATAWLIDDFGTCTDTQGTAAILQNAFRRAGLGYLRSTTGTPTIAEPTIP